MLDELYVKGGVHFAGSREQQILGTRILTGQTYDTFNGLPYNQDTRINEYYASTACPFTPQTLLTRGQNVLAKDSRLAQLHGWYAEPLTEDKRATFNMTITDDMVEEFYRNTVRPRTGLLQDEKNALAMMKASMGIESTRGLSRLPMTDETAEQMKARLDRIAAVREALGDNGNDMNDDDDDDDNADQPGDRPNRQRDYRRNVRDMGVGPDEDDDDDGGDLDRWARVPPGIDPVYPSDVADDGGRRPRRPQPNRLQDILQNNNIQPRGRGRNPGRAQVSNNPPSIRRGDEQGGPGRPGRPGPPGPPNPTPGAPMRTDADIRERNRKLREWRFNRPDDGRDGGAGAEKTRSKYAVLTEQPVAQPVDQVVQPPGQDPSGGGPRMPVASRTSNRRKKPIVPATGGAVGAKPSGVNPLIQETVSDDQFTRIMRGQLYWPREQIPWVPSPAASSQGRPGNIMGSRPVVGATEEDMARAQGLKVGPSLQEQSAVFSRAAAKKTPQPAEDAQSKVAATAAVSNPGVGSNPVPQTKLEDMSEAFLKKPPVLRLNPPPFPTTSVKNKRVMKEEEKKEMVAAGQMRGQVDTRPLHVRQAEMTNVTERSGEDKLDESMDRMPLPPPKDVPLRQRIDQVMMPPPPRPPSTERQAEINQRIADADDLDARIEEMMAELRGVPAGLLPSGQPLPPFVASEITDQRTFNLGDVVPSDYKVFQAKAYGSVHPDDLSRLVVMLDVKPRLNDYVGYVSRMLRETNSVPNMDPGAVRRALLEIPLQGNLQYVKRQLKAMQDSPNIANTYASITPSMDTSIRSSMRISYGEFPTLITQIIRYMDHIQKFRNDKVRPVDIIYDIHQSIVIPYFRLAGTGNIGIRGLQPFISGNFGMNTQWPDTGFMYLREAGPIGMALFDQMATRTNDIRRLPHPPEVEGLINAAPRIPPPKTRQQIKLEMEDLKGSSSGSGSGSGNGSGSSGSLGSGSAGEERKSQSRGSAAGRGSKTMEDVTARVQQENQAAIRRAVQAIYDRDQAEADSNAERADARGGDLSFTTQGTVATARRSRKSSGKRVAFDVTDLVQQQNAAAIREAVREIDMRETEEAASIAERADARAGDLLYTTDKQSRSSRSKGSRKKAAASAVDITDRVKQESEAQLRRLVRDIEMREEEEEKERQERVANISSGSDKKSRSSGSRKRARDRAKASLNTMGMTANSRSRQA